MESRASRRVVPLAFPSLRSTFHPLYHDMLELVCNMLSPCHPEIGTNGTATGLYPTFLINPDTSLDFFEPSLAVWWLSRIHFVNSNDKLLDSESICKQGVFSSLTILRNTSFELTGA